MGETKKVGVTGRFGARYGVGIRRRLLKVEPKQFSKHVCPSCGHKRVKRVSRGIFECSKCGVKFVGGAYLPQTLSGELISKVVSQKAFSVGLLKASESNSESEVSKVDDKVEGNSEVKKKVVSKK